jgi:hypothetical protein
MKKTYKVALMAGVGMVSLWFAGNALAFHDGGVAHCDGCHTMHNSSDGAVNAVGGAGTIGTGVTSALTKGSDPSSTCLNCHAASAGSYHVMTTTGPVDGTHTNSGGDFYWLTVDVPKGRGTSLKANHGHNVVAADYALGQDPTLTSGPSDGTVSYNAEWLGCNSCHDPHGKKDNNANPLPIEGSGSYGGVNPDPTAVVLGNFRLLGGEGYDGGAQASGISFSAGDPVAVSGGNGRDNATAHVDYGSGMSEWCANCHSGFTTADTITNHRHPAGDDASLGGTIVANYNAYVTTGDMTGTAATAYDHLVPFERGVVDADADGTPDNLDATAGGLASDNANGPDVNSNVMCLTCHRAHASAFDNMGRWNFASTMLIEEEANAIAAGFTMQQLNNGDDMSRYGEFQRSLCNKCHVQD